MTNPLFDALFAPLIGQTRPLLHLADVSQISADQFHALTARLFHALAQAGVQPGDRIAVQVTKSPEALALYGATVAKGAIFLPLNTAYTHAEIDYFLVNVTPRLFICAPA